MGESCHVRYENNGLFRVLGGYRGLYILPSYGGIIVNHDKDPS